MGELAAHPTQVEHRLKFCPTSPIRKSLRCHLRFHRLNHCVTDFGVRSRKLWKSARRLTAAIIGIVVAI